MLICVTDRHFDGSGARGRMPFQPIRESTNISCSMEKRLIIFIWGASKPSQILFSFDNWRTCTKSCVYLSGNLLIVNQLLFNSLYVTIHAMKTHWCLQIVKIFAQSLCLVRDQIKLIHNDCAIRCPQDCFKKFPIASCKNFIWLKCILKPLPNQGHLSYFWHTDGVHYFLWYLLLGGVNAGTLKYFERYCSMMVGKLLGNCVEKSTKCPMM